MTKSQILRYRHRVAQQSREQMKDFIRRMDLNGRSIVRLLRYGRAPHVITAAAQRLRPELVCVGSVGRTGLPQILLGSVAEHVLREVSCDILVARSGSLSFELP
jgi:nucleotide-binding universal stress UspA family protein